MNTKLALYFGCYGDTGHFIWDPEQHIGRLRLPSGVTDFPWEPAILDTGLLKNRKVRDHYTGKVIWICAGGESVVWHAFLWWDNSVDRRPGSNSGFYVRGFRATREDARPAFEYACSVWPKVVKRQVVPLVLDMEDPMVDPGVSRRVPDRERDLTAEEILKQLDEAVHSDVCLQVQIGPCMVSGDTPGAIHVSVRSGCKPEICSTYPTVRAGILGVLAAVDEQRRKP